MADLGVAGQAALAALDRALAVKPRKDQPSFTETTEHLCTMRDLLIVQCLQDPSRLDQLARLNSIISCSLGGHFPIGPMPWPLLLSARSSLQRLLAEVELC